MKKKKPHILCLGETGFPVGFGAIQRLLLLSKGLVESGCKVTVISFKGVHKTPQDFPAVGQFEGVDYRYTSGSVHFPKSFFRRNWLKMVGKVKELAYLWQLKREGNLHSCIVSTMDIDSLLLYRVWLKMLGVPMVLNLVELNSAIVSHSGLWTKLNDYLFDRFAPRLCDGICPISDYLIAHSEKQSPQKPMLKVPVICDFERFDIEATANGETSLLYCGAASYLQLVEFVLQAFDRLEVDGKPVFLDFILGGKENELAAVRALISKAKNRDKVRLKPNLQHHAIPVHYANAAALLIPLRPTVQDAARFPHKLGEYLASRTPVITTAFGEIRHYDFIDQQTAFVADEYDPGAFAEKMQFVIDRPDRARSVGAAGREMGIRNFNYKTLGSSIKGFIFSLKK